MNNNKKSPSPTAQLIELAKKNARFFQDEKHDCYVECETNGRRDTYPTNSKTYKDSLRFRAYEEMGQIPSTQVVEDTIAIINGRTRSSGPTEKVFVRLGHKEEKVFLDLCDDRREVVAIDSGGWTITRNPGVNFWRPQNMLRLPLPSRSGTLEDLRDFVNVPDSQWTLAKHCVIGMGNPRGPYPITKIAGRFGTAKTSCTKYLQQSIDPNAVGPRCLPRNPEELVLAGKHAHIVAIDNMGFITNQMSDALCRLSTGGGYAVRKHYTNDEEYSSHVCRPCIANGIGDVFSQPDVIDRLVVLSLDPIPPTKRKPMRELDSLFEAKHPSILGGLLDAISAAIREIPNIESTELHRMADWCLWNMAAERGMGWPEGEFMTAYTENREAASTMALENSVVAGEIRKLMDRHSDWQGTATNLLDEINNYADENLRRSRQWPNSAQKLSNDLSKAEPNLADIGIQVSRTRNKSRRQITITKVVTLVTSSPEADSNVCFSREDDADDEMTMLKGGMDWIDPENDF